METGIHDIFTARKKTRRLLTMIILEKIIKFADKYEMFPSSGIILVGVSGGADSMALLEALLEISPERGFTVNVAHFNHRLRGDESLRDLEFVRDYCAARSVPFYTDSGDVKVYAAESSLSVEEAAREMRYGFFCAAAVETGAASIATAHTADDNIETMILNLARGAGAAGLSGIPPIREMRNSEFQIPNSGAALPRIIRPILRVSRDEVMSFVTERGIPFVEDSTNALEIYTRNRVRRTVIPVIKEINPKYTEAAAAAAELLRVDDEYLSALADEFIIEHCKISPMRQERSPCPTPQFSNLNSQFGREAITVGAGELAELSLAISGRVIRRLCGGKASYSHVKAILELCKKNDPSARLSLPGMVVYREYDSIVFAEGADDETEGFEPVYPADGECLVIPELEMKLSCKSVIYDGILCNVNKSVTFFLFKKNDICGRIIVRPRREGDKVRFIGQNATKTLKKLFIEKRVPERKRSLIPVIADDSGVLAVYGLGIGDRAIPEPGEPAVQIEFEIQGADID